MTKTNKTVGVVEQIRIAGRNPAALTVGCLLGAFVPSATFWISHFEFSSKNPWSMNLVMVLGGLLFSAKTVGQWAAKAFQDPYKAVGFVVLSEGVMVTTSTLGLALTALSYLIFINAVATGCTLALADMPKAAAKSKKMGRTVAENDNGRASGRVRKAA